MNLATACDAIAANKDAEFRVESSISVREQYKTKLRVLIDALLPSSTPPRSIRAPQSPPGGLHGTTANPSRKATTDASKKKQTRDAVADRLRVRATMPAGKELQVVGDWLLLLRAASVSVVESITQWRHAIHQDRPVPYEVNHSNYLLQMANDVDFLDQCDDVVAWLGFRLVRNPFVVSTGLDGNKPMEAKDVTSPTRRKTDQNKPGAETIPHPPPSLVKPLISITPEDDVVDGSRIERAQAVVKDEEALNGQPRVSCLVGAYLAKPLEATLLSVPESDEEEQQHGQTKRTIFDEIAAMSKRLRQSEHHLACLLRDQARAVDLAKLVEDQIQLTIAHCNQDLVSDHRVWQYRDKCRSTTLCLSEKAREQLTSRLQSLSSAITKSQDLVTKQKHHLDQLVTLKEQRRQKRLDKKRQCEADETARRREAIRNKTLERSRVFKAKRPKKNNDTGANAMPPSPTPSKHILSDDAAEELDVMLGAPASPVDRRVELDQKRLENLERRRQQKLYQEHVLTQESEELNRRRGENAHMFLEDRLSRLVEARRRLLSREQLQKERAKQLAAVPICSIVQAIGGAGGKSDRKFVLSVYHQRAKGYVPDGLRFVAYDPSTSTSLPLMISTREYNALGYGRTLEGLTAFCQWLYIIYEKRKRQFKLIWSGAPCPPPLRLREYDHALVCVHKEGIRLTQHSTIQPSHAPFNVIAIYIRTNDPSRLRFVVSAVDGGSDAMEFAVSGCQLLPASSMFLRSDVEGGQAYISWLHALEEDCDTTFEDGARSSANGTRIFSGEMAGVDSDRRVRVHIFDVSPTEYELHIISPQATEPQSLPPSHKPVILLKHDVNPYSVRLPGSVFGDLINYIRLERRPIITDSESVNLVARILPSWRTRMARYVRAIRMARFGCKVDGVLFFVTATLVQQKTEFRAYLLFELASVRDVGSRCLLRLGLSHLLRCPDATSQFRHGGSVDLVEQESKCDVCLCNLRRSTPVACVDSAHLYHGDDGSNSDEYQGACSSCDATQTSRLAIVRMLLDDGNLASESALASMYYAVCSTCQAVPPPIVIVIPTRAGSIGVDGAGDDEALLRHYFTWFDQDVDFTDDGFSRIWETLEQSRLCVIRVTAAPISTHANVASIATRLREFLHLEQLEALSVTIAVIYRELDIFSLNTQCVNLNGGFDSSSDIILEEALRDTAAAILHVGDSTPISFDEAEDDHESISSFEGYLVAEALLVEATRVILQPYEAWRMPGETVGASSWSAACQFLRDPQQLARNLQDGYRTFLAMDHHARQIVDAYAAHPKWPTRLEEVRTPFQPLLSCVLHVMYTQRLLDLGGGLFSTPTHRTADCTSANKANDGIYALDHGTKAVIIGQRRAQADYEEPLQLETPTGSIE